ncbi:RNA-directed DNA polymerase, eukaryota [Tanacetum coccineum]
MGTENRSFACVLNVGSGNCKVTKPSPAIVLDDDCLIERDYSCSIMGKIKDINAIPNLYLILSNEGFDNVKISHLGGLWVLLDMDSIDTKEKVFKHVGVGEIVSFWGELTNVEDSENMTISFKRLCVKVKSSVTINDKIKVIVKGKKIWICVKELEPWTPKFIEVKDDNSLSGDESVGTDLENNNDNLMNDFELDNENEIDHVSESSCMNENDLVYKQVPKSPENPSKSADPFGIYSLLEKNKNEVVLEENMENVASDKSDPQFPPGFIPDVGKEIVEEVNYDKEPQLNENGVAFDFSEIKCVSSIKSRGSLLDVMDELIKVGHAMGYNMDGCMKNIEIQELNSKHRVSFVALQETKMESIDLFSIKVLWGNFAFDYVLSPSMGFSGGILCAWDPSLFHKDNSTISDSFVALRGTWIPSATKILIISVYAPHDLNEKRMLWEFLGHLIDTWDSECVLLGDFNEVRSINERYGTVFNPHGANAFNNFISMTGLVDLPLEGYSYTWSHKSTSKMSILDMFLISKGLLTVFPSLSALCLDRHLSDHRPILMCELNVDYGPIPFHLFHSSFNKNGSDKLVENSWVVRFAGAKHSNEELVSERANLFKELHDITSKDSLDLLQKAKIRWAIEEDENSRYDNAQIIHFELLRIASKHFFNLLFDDDLIAVL